MIQQRRVEFIKLKKLKGKNKGFVLLNILVFILLFSAMMIGEAVMYNIIANKTSELAHELRFKNEIESNCIDYISGRFSKQWLKEEYSKNGSFRFRLEECGSHYKFYFYDTLFPEKGYYVIFDNILSSKVGKFVIYEDGYYEVQHELDS